MAKYISHRKVLQLPHYILKIILPSGSNIGRAERNKILSAVGSGLEISGDDTDDFIETKMSFDKISAY